MYLHKFDIKDDDLVAKWDPIVGIRYRAIYCVKGFGLSSYRTLSAF